MFQDEAPLLRAHAHLAFADTWTAAVNLVVVEAMGAGPTGRITYAAGGRLDGIGRRAIGDMVSSAGASSFEMIGTLRERPTQPLSPEYPRGTSRVQVDAI
jgi:hypothetical protein